MNFLHVINPLYYINLANFKKAVVEFMNYNDGLRNVLLKGNYDNTKKYIEATIKSGEKTVHLGKSVEAPNIAELEDIVEQDRTIEKAIKTRSSYYKVESTEFGLN